MQDVTAIINLRYYEMIITKYLVGVYFVILENKKNNRVIPLDMLQNLFNSMQFNRFPSGFPDPSL